MIDLVITGGEVATPNTVEPLDIGVDKGKIVFLATPGAVTVQATRQLDASGRLVVPGGVDAHVHFRFPQAPGVLAQGAGVGSRAAAFGGTTTFIDFAYQHGEGSLLAAIEAKRTQVEKDQPSIDFALHSMITGPTTLDTLDAIAEAISEGVTSFKMFTTFSVDDSGGGALYSDDGRIWGVMERVASEGGIVMVHCEDDSLIDHNLHCLQHSHRTGIAHLAEARTPLAEEAAIRRMILLARRSSSPLYVCHITSRWGMEAVYAAQSDRLPVYGEVLHNNLSYTSDRYERSDGVLYHCFPGLKAQDDRDALWGGVRDGVVSTISSDDWTLPRAMKESGHTVETASGGHNGIETRMGVAYSEAVSQRHVDVRRFVELTAEGPAKLFGLYPRKGALAPGSDADIVLMDPVSTHIIRQSELHSDCDYSIWDGRECTGYPVSTISRGRILVEEGKWTGGEGGGAFVRSGSPTAP